MPSKYSDDYKWLLVEWQRGGRNIIFIESVMGDCKKDLKPGDLMRVKRRKEQRMATLIAHAEDRDVLDAMLRGPEKEEEAGPSTKVPEDEEDEPFDSSASSWVPSDDCGAQSEDSEVETKKIKIESCKRQYFNRRSNKKIITPSQRATPVRPMIQGSSTDSMTNQKRAHNLFRNISNNSFLPDSTRRNNLENGAAIQTVAVNVREIISVLTGFNILIKMFYRSNPSGFSVLNQSSTEHVRFPSKVENMSQTSNKQTVDEDVMEEEEQNLAVDEFNRSHDNVLITNKYNNVAVKKAPNKRLEKDEWVRIGSGKTLIHRDKFKRVNWKSFTIATRTLLLAVFPRRVLATHSLTGKKSPAFQNKPAKMCLDPKKTSDVIMEIMDRFDVKENFVRNIITTKCADECKMWKTRLNKKKNQKNNENIPPPPSNIFHEILVMRDSDVNNHCTALSAIYHHYIRFFY